LYFFEGKGLLWQEVRVKAFFNLFQEFRGVLGKFSNFELRVAPNACAVISRLNRARIAFRLYLLRIVLSKQLKQRFIRRRDPDEVIEMLFIAH